jgi:hypothetical protein
MTSNPAMLDARLSRLENQLRDRLRLATHAIQTGQHRRLAVDYINPTQIRKLFQSLQERAAEFGCDLLILHIIPISSKSRSLCYSMEKMSTCSYMCLWFPAARYYDFSNCILFRYPFSPTTFSSPKFSMTSSLCPPITIGFLSNYLQWIFSVVTA